jgi:trehalose-phosphatase
VAGATEAARVTEFLEALPAAPARVLLLDYDGTLAPFRIERDHATPYVGVREAVGALARSGRTRVVVISGRSLDGLRPLLGVEPPPELWGTHGWERLEPGHPPILRPLPDGSADALAQAARALAGPELDGRIEVKPASVALHVRGLPEPDAERVIAQGRAAWEPLARAAPLELHPFDGGLELRVAGWHKGDALRAVLATEPAGAAVAYLGDDATDEDAFGALEELSAAGRIRGLSVLVRSEPRPSRAPVRLEPPGQLLDFLARWRSAAG